MTAWLGNSLLAGIGLLGGWVAVTELGPGIRRWVAWRRQRPQIGQYVKHYPLCAWQLFRIDYAFWQENRP